MGVHVAIVILVLALIIILIGAELFTNGIEWVGRKLDLAEGAVGSVLAAVGTALPETMIPIIAILFGTGEASHAVGIGAILGAPFMLATLAMFVTGAAVIGFRRRRSTGDTMRVHAPTLLHDMRYFAVAYAIAIGAAFLPIDPVWPKWIIAIGLLAIYAWYVRGHFTAANEAEEEELSPLRFHRIDYRARRANPAVPRLRIVNAQVIFALGCIIVGALFFVEAVEEVASAIGVDELLLALVVAPIATELPEKFNSIIWVRQNKDTLSMGNITGAMVFQSTIPTVVALIFASDAWHISDDSWIAFASAAIAFLASAAIFIPLARRGTLRGQNLLVGGLFYLGYLLLVVGAVLGIVG
jgi:cation:H+ antiporter